VVESTVHYEPPAEYRVVTGTVVESAFDESWDGLVKRLTESSFPILSLDKTSRFLVVGVDRSTDDAPSANSPARYVDCGRLRWSLTEGGRSEQFDHAVAESSRHVEADRGEEAYEIRDVSRAVDLAARATLYLQPEGPERTRVTVNARYTLTLQTTGTTRQVPRKATADEGKPRAVKPLREEIRLTTFKQSAREDRGADSTDDPKPEGDGGPFCRATGEFERALLALTAPPAST
jgi:hypothetical protein